MMQKWFPDARLGIFIHYGIYSVRGVWESWAFKAKEMSYKEYMKQLDGFTASRLDAGQWARLFKRAGARYAVLTSKHHDGVALFDSKYSDLTTVKATPARRDIVKEYCDAVRAEGLRTGLYFTQLDWSHPCYTSLHWKTGRMTLDKLLGGKKWEKFLDFHRNQLTEILTRYGDIDLLWFDGDWERTSEDWRFKEMKDYITRISPCTVVNSRIGRYGDYETPEQQMPVTPPDGAWEYCMTINDSWGYRPHDRNFKTAEEVIRVFVETITKGGNLLLDVGPREDGTIPEEEVEVLEKLGQFNRENNEAVFESVPVKNNVYFDGGMMKSADGRKAYLFLYDKPSHVVTVRGLGVKAARVTCGGKNMTYVHEGGDLYIMPRSAALSDGVNVITLEFAKEGAL